MILYGLCFLPAQFCCIIVPIWKVESHVQIADMCALWKISSHTFLHAYPLPWSVFTEPLPSSGRLFFLRYSGFQPSCRIAPSLRLLVPSSLTAYHHFFFSEGTCPWPLIGLANGTSAACWVRHLVSMASNLGFGFIELL
jgi:hypothetical protein